MNVIPSLGELQLGVLRKSRQSFNAPELAVLITKIVELALKNINQRIKY